MFSFAVQQVECCRMESNAWLYSVSNAAIFSVIIQCSFIQMAQSHVLHFYKGFHMMKDTESEQTLVSLDLLNCLHSSGFITEMYVYILQERANRQTAILTFCKYLKIKFCGTLRKICKHVQLGQRIAVQYTALVCLQASKALKLHFNHK